MNPQKKYMIITGAGSGIGRAISEVLSEKNPTTNLILVGRNLDNLNQTLKLLKNSTQHTAAIIDMTDHRSIKDFKSKLIQNKIHLSGLVLNAGIGGENEYGDHDRWDEIIATNLTGPYLLTKELLPLLNPSTKTDSTDYKNIIFISSILARLGIPKYSAYCASKAGLLGLMRSLAAEHASDKILVNAICPGWVETDMSIDGIKTIALGSGKSIETILNEQMGMIPLRKMSTPNEVAELVNFLLSGLQNSITGQTFDINNGALMV